MRPRLPVIKLLPKYLAALRVDGQIDCYRLRLHWDGQYVLIPQKNTGRRACIALVSHALPFRRKLQKLPDTSTLRSALIKAAPDEFPLPSSDMHYGLGFLGKEPYLYALPDTALEVFRQSRLDPAIVLVAADPANPSDCLASVEYYLKQGISADLIRKSRFIPTRLLWQGLLGGGLFCSLMVSLVLLAWPDLFSSLMEKRLAPLRERGSAIPALYRTTERMAESQRQAAKLFSSQEARLPAALSSLMNSLPAGHYLRSVEFRNGLLKIYGEGNQMREWLVSQGFPAERITIEDGGSFKRFRAEKSL